MSAYDGNGNQRSLLVPSTDGWDDAVKDASDRLIQGQILLFADWRYTAGKEREPVALGRRLIARSTLHYWRRWEGGKIVQHILRQPGKKLPERDALGYDDRNEWDIGLDGEPQDPWQETRSILFEDPSTAELYTFVTTSGGGRSAVVTLGDQISRVRAVHADAVPLVELQAAEMKTQHGPKSKPVFRVVQWLTSDGTPVGERSVSAKEAKRLADDREMGDEIPF